LRGADSLAGTGFGKDDVPEVVLGSGEAEANEAALVFFADRGDDAVHGFGSHFVKELDPLAGQERGVHNDQGAVATDKLGGSLEVNGFAFGHLAAHFERNLQGDAHRAPPFGISGPMHELAGKGAGKSLPCFPRRNKWRCGNQAEDGGGCSGLELTFVVV